MSARGGRIAFVVQRYGEGVTGGSETLARAFAERLGGDVTVFTTCASDYVTWRNDLPPGRQRVGGVEVLRFPVARERDLASFNALSDRLFGRERTREEELEWLRLQGPEVPELVDALEAAADGFERIVFFTYLYYPTYFGLTRLRERSVLVPTAHDEPALSLSVFRGMFEAARGLAFCSAPEAELVRSRFPVSQTPWAVTGIGIDPGPPPDVDGFRKRHGVEGDFVLYCGRIDAGKGCEELLRFFEAYRTERRRDLQFLLSGNLAMDLGGLPGVRYLGFLSEEEKRAAMASARVILCSSPYESLSIVLLEALSLGTPALVNARSPVLKDHCLRSNAGLFYEDRHEFAEALDLLLRDESLRSALGANGRRYVSEAYRWEAVLGRFRDLLARAQP